MHKMAASKDFPTNTEVLHTIITTNTKIYLYFYTDIVPFLLCICTYLIGYAYSSTEPDLASRYAYYI